PPATSVTTATVAGLVERTSRAVPLLLILAVTFAPAPLMVVKTAPTVRAVLRSTDTAAVPLAICMVDRLRPLPAYSRLRGVVAVTAGCSDAPIIAPGWSAAIPSPLATVPPPTSVTVLILIAACLLHGLIRVRLTRHFPP